MTRKITCVLLMILAFFIFSGCSPRKQIQLTLSHEVDLTGEIERFNEIYEENAKIKKLSNSTYALKFTKSPGSRNSWKYKRLFETLRDFNNESYPVRMTLHLTETDEEVLQTINLPKDASFEFELDTDRGVSSHWQQKNDDLVTDFFTFDVPLSGNLPDLEYRYGVNSSITDEELYRQLSSLTRNLPPGTAEHEIIFNDNDSPFPDMDIRRIQDDTLSLLVHQRTVPYNPYSYMLPADADKEEYSAFRRKLRSAGDEVSCLLLFPLLSTYLTEFNYYP